METTAEFPEKLQFLFEPARYKVAYGGRGSAKSWGFARALLIKGAGDTLRIPCCREIQNSIADSVHALLSQQVELLNLGGFYRVTDKYIEGRNGTLFTFHGLKHNVQNLKSLEGADICWVEEAQSVSPSSWKVLTPTIRKPGSEIWISFNPELEGDATYQRFVLHPPTDARVVKVNWSDNPWFPAVLRQEMEDLRARDYDEYLTVWEGHCKQVLDGAILADQIREATKDGRFTRVPYDRSKPVSTFWDLGRRDKTAIWFVQQIGFEFRVIDYYENQGKDLAHYLKVLSEKPYIYDEDWQPHDATHETLAAKRTIEQQMRDAGRKVRIIPKTSIADRINAGRSIFNRCWFDAENCADGINALRHWRYDVDPDTKQFSKIPLHDDASHGGDAFTYFAVSMGETKRKKPAPERAGGWMG